MSKKQTDVVFARAKQVTYVSAKTYKLVAPRDTVGKLPTAPYTVLQPADGTETQERMSGARSTSHPRYTFHFVGASYDNAQGLLEDVKAQFIDPVSGFPYPIVVAGELARNITWESPQPVQVDNDLTPPLIYATAELSWDADPL